jgi:predicted lactoylglutathione lyase
MRMIFVNLPVKDLEAAKRFYAGLGFTLNEQFTNEDAASFVIEENIVVMLLTHGHFKNFTLGQIPANSNDKQSLICLSAGGREEVDGFVTKALASGGSAWMPPQDHGFMYGASFQDPDGHVWEVMWMDQAAIDQGQHMEIELA